MKNIVLFTILFILGFFISYETNPKEISINNTQKVKSSKKEFEESSIKIKEELKIIEKEYIPFFIKDELEKYGFNRNNLSLKEWEKFLDEIKKQNYIQLQNIEGSLGLLHLAAIKGKKQLMLKLIDYGFDINKKDERGYTPFFYAIKKDTSLEFIKELIKKSANLETNINDPKKPDTLLIALGRYNFNKKDITNEEFVDYLLDNGFEFNKKHYLSLVKGKSFNKNIYLKRYIDNMEVNELYNKKGEIGHLLNMIREVDNEILSYMLDNKVDVDTYPGGKGVLLMGTMKKDLSLENYEKILEIKSLDLNKANGGGKTPLIFTIDHLDYDKMTLLLKKGADPIKKDKFRNINAYDYLEKAKIPLEEKVKIKDLFDTYIKN